MPDTRPDTKTTARGTAFAARKQAFAAQGETGAVTRATGHLLAEIGAKPGIVAGYLPIRTEIDPRPAMAVLHAMGATVCVPVIDANGQPLRFRAWSPTAPLIDGPFGAQTPAAGAFHTPQTVILPLVAFDARGNRLGYGGGFYDRTLEQLRAAGPTRAIGLAFDAQQLETLPLEPTDQPLDALVTETGTHQFVRPALAVPPRSAYPS